MNPFNQPRFRDEQELGSAYRVVQEVHDQLDVIAYVAENMGSVRSGNIELKSDDEGKIYWKYVLTDDWILWGDLTEWFTPFLEPITIQITNIEEELGLTNQRIDLDIQALELLKQEVDLDRAVITEMAPIVEQNTLDILTIKNDILGLVQKDVTIESDIASILQRLTDIETRLGVLENV